MKFKNVLMLLITTLSFTSLVACGDDSSKDTPISSSSSSENSSISSSLPSSTVTSDDEIRKIYELAVNGGYEGTYEEWLDSIKGESGNSITSISFVEEKDGKAIYCITFSNGKTSTVEIPLPQNDNYKSAYDIYIENHPNYTKSESEWIEDLVNGRLSDENTCIVKFVVNYRVYHTEAIKKGDIAIKPQDPVKTGTTFKGWYLNDNKWLFEAYKVTNNITLEAKFEY